MIANLRQAGLIWPSLFTLAALAVLVGLGNWQWQRMKWKEGLLRDIEFARNAPAVDLARLLSENTADGILQLGKLRFRQVRLRVAGEVPEQLFVWNPQSSGPAWSVVRSDRLAEPVAGFDHVLIVVGLVADKDRKALQLNGGTTSVPTTTGRIRLNEPNPAAPPPVPARREWFTRDLVSMTGHINHSLRRREPPGRFLPFFIEQTEPVSPPLQPNKPRLTLTNRHFEYALTWWGLACALIGVYGAFAWSKYKMS